MDYDKKLMYHISKGVLMEKNIYQRMSEVQKKVQTVFKNETVKMSDNDKGYKAVTHDDVAAALHLPLAECGVFMLPDITEFKTDQFDKTNQWGKTVTWYRTDIKIKVKWVNVDKPDDFIESTGAAFALDTSDKSFAKAYSLALKIVLLKVHLLESRDGEEQRPFDEGNGGAVAGKGQPNQSTQNKNSPKPNTNQQPKPNQTAPAKQNIPVINAATDSDLAQIDTLLASRPGVNADDVNYYLKCNGVGEKDPIPKTIYDAVIKLLTPEDCSSEEIRASADDIRQAMAKPKAKAPGDFLVTFGKDTSGKKLSELPEKTLRDMNAWATTELGKPTPAVARGDLFNFQTELKTFFKSMDLTL